MFSNLKPIKRTVRAAVARASEVEPAGEGLLSVSTCFVHDDVSAEAYGNGRGSAVVSAHEVHFQVLL